MTDAAIPTTTVVRRQTLTLVTCSEWVKLRTLRSTWLGLGAVLLVLIGLGAIAAAVSTGSVDVPQQGGPSFAGTDALSTVLTGANVAVLLLGVLGCLAGAREYGSRMIVATIAAVPRRWPVAVGKTVSLTAVVLPTALVGSFGAFVVGMAVLRGGGATTVALSGDGVLRSVVGMGGYLTAIALLGLSLGILLRSVAASIGVLVGAVLIAPPVAGALLPDSWGTVLQFLPTNAAASFTTVTATGNTVLPAGAGAATLAVWVLVGLAAAMVAITRRDV